jgi:succinate dehydrogenase hydrophobic anchor subunit
MTLMKNLNKYFSTQAKVAIVGYILLSIAFFVPVKTPEEKEIKYNLSERVLSFIVMLIPIAISVYTINCMVVGVSDGGIPCNVLAWLNSLSVFVWSFIILLGTLMLLKNTKVSNETTEGFSKCRKMTEEGFSNCRRMDETN